MSSSYPKNRKKRTPVKCEICGKVTASNSHYSEEHTEEGKVKLASKMEKMWEASPANKTGYKYSEENRPRPIFEKYSFNRELWDSRGSVMASRSSNGRFLRWFIREYDIPHDESGKFTNKGANI